MLITNGKIITWEEPNRILEGCALRISEGRIAEISPQAELLRRRPEDEQLDANGQYIMPGNICAHTHFYGAFARGMAIPVSPAKDFPEILQKLWWPLDRALSMDDVRASAEVMLVDAIRHGTTTLFDHHASPNAIDGSLDVIAGVVDKAGVRAVLCYEVTDRDGETKSKAGIAENVRFIERTRKNFSAEGRIAATFGLHASLTLSDETLDACRQAAPNDIGFHIHVAESEADEYDSLAKSGLRVVDRLYRRHLLGKHSILVHCVHVDMREANIIAESGAWVAHQPRSNMNNGVGVTPVESFMRLGIPVCLGTDGFSHTMWQEWKAAYLVQKLWHLDSRRMLASDVAAMGITNNTALAGSFFRDAPIGKLVEGAFADLIFVDYHPFTPLSTENLPWHIVFGFHESMVTTTIVAGKVLMKDRKLLTMDEEAVTAHARELAKKTWMRYEQNVKQQF